MKRVIEWTFCAGVTAFWWLVLGVAWLVLLAVFLLLWPFVRDGLQTRATPAVDITGKPFPDIRHYQRDEGDETDEVVAEGGFCGAWPGIAAIDAIKRAHPRLSDMQAYAVAVARTRQERETA